MTAPEISIVVTAYNRVNLLRLTLANLVAAIGDLKGEIVVVDDGSTPPLHEQLGKDCDKRVRVIRQDNEGSAAARHRGILEALGEYVLVCDSDDFIARDKLVRQIDAMRRASVDISYCDEGFAYLDKGGVEDEMPRLEPAREKLRTAKSIADLMIRVQPMPHNMVFRRDWLMRCLERPMIDPRREFGPSGDTWIYYNAATSSGKTVKVDAALSFQTKHDGERYQSHWERLGVSALLLVEAFAERCPRTEQTREAREYAGAGAFQSWRRLPRGFSRVYEERLLAIWRAMPDGPLADLGGPRFCRLAGLIGPVAAGRLMKLRRPGYGAIRTLSAEQHELLIRSMPPRPRLA